MPFSAVKAGHTVAVHVIVQPYAAFQAPSVIAEFYPHPLVTLENMVRIVFSVVARADIIPRQVMVTAHPPRRDGLRSE
jgi:hypothetical protein